MSLIITNTFCIFRDTINLSSKIFCCSSILTRSRLYAVFMSISSQNVSEIAENQEEYQADKKLKLKKDKSQKAKIKENKKKIRLESKRQNKIGKECYFDDNWLNETDYYIENGLCKVFPYFYTFTAYCKGRWIGRTLLDIFQTEFRQDNPHDKIKAILDGKVLCNDTICSLDYTLKNNDLIKNTVHRHEFPVISSDINIIHDDNELVVIDKPSSIPVHPCGRYRHNSLTFMMRKLYHYKNLRAIYRLDRLTSGVYIFCKNDIKARQMIKLIEDRKVIKEYICKVEGKFPSNKIECNEPLGVLSHKLGLQWVDKSENGKCCQTLFELLSTNNKESIVRCFPKTGRTHQIRVHLQYLGFPIVNDNLYNSTTWGPMKGKSGNFCQTKEELLNSLEKAHQSSRFYLINDNNKRSKPNWFDENCQECLKPSREPTKDELIMYLHALSYEGPNWKFSTDYPSWTEL